VSADPAPARGAVHGIGLSAAPSPPFVRFERKRPDAFIVWIAAPPHDVGDTDATITTAQSRGLTPARALVEVFDYILPPAADALLTRYEAQDTDGKFWADVEAAGLTYAEPAEDLPPMSKRAKALARRTNCIALEDTVARSPLVIPSDVRLARMNGAQATPDQVYVGSYWAHVFLRWPTWDGWIRPTFAATVDLLGIGRGGWQYDNVRELVEKMHALIVPREYITEKGAERLHRFNIIEDSDVPESGKGDGTYGIRLGDTYRSRLLNGRFTPLDLERMARARDAFPRNAVAQRLWYFLDSQELPWAWGWPIFRVPEGQVAGPGDVGHPLAEFLGLWEKRHRNVASKIRHHAAEVVAAFPEYTITVDPDTVPTMYRMFADRGHRLPAPVDNSPASCSEGLTVSCSEGLTPPCSEGLTPAGTIRGYARVKSKVKSKEEQEQTTRGPQSGPATSDSFHDENEPPRACPPDLLLAELDRPGAVAGYFADVLGEHLAAELACAMCDQVRKATEGAGCAAAAGPCSLYTGAVGDYGGALRHRIQRGEVAHPRAYVRAAIADDAGNPLALLGGYEADARSRLEDCHAALCRRRPPADPADFGYTPKGMDPPKEPPHE